MLNHTATLIHKHFRSVVLLYTCNVAYPENYKNYSSNDKKMTDIARKRYVYYLYHDLKWLHDTSVARPQQPSHPPQHLPSRIPLRGSPKPGFSVIKKRWEKKWRRKKEIRKHMNLPQNACVASALTTKEVLFFISSCLPQWISAHH